MAKPKSGDNSEVRVEALLEWLRKYSTNDVIPNVHELRIFIVEFARLLYPENTKNKNFSWKEKPSHWADNVPFLDPNNKTDNLTKPKKDDLECMYNYLIKKYKASQINANIDTLNFEDKDLFPVAEGAAEVNSDVQQSLKVPCESRTEESESAFYPGDGHNVMDECLLKKDREGETVGPGVCSMPTHSNGESFPVCFPVQESMKDSKGVTCSYGFSVDPQEHFTDGSKMVFPSQDEQVADSNLKLGVKARGCSPTNLVDDKSEISCRNEYEVPKAEMTKVSPITGEPIDKPDCGPLQAKSCNYEMRDENKNNYQSKKAPSFGEASEFRNLKRRWENETKKDEKEQKILRSEQQGNHYLEGCSHWNDEKVSKRLFNRSEQDEGPKHVFDNKAEDEGKPEKDGHNVMDECLLKKDREGETVGPGVCSMPTHSNGKSFLVQESMKDSEEVTCSYGFSVDPQEHFTDGSKMVFPSQD